MKMTSAPILLALCALYVTTTTSFVMPPAYSVRGLHKFMAEEAAEGEVEVADEDAAVEEGTARVEEEASAAPPAAEPAKEDVRSPDGLGALPPLGLWDPLNLIKDTDKFERRRAVEIKHGRIAMAAFVGMAVEEMGSSFPGSLDLAGDYPFSDVLKDGMGFAALNNIPPLGLAQIALFAAIVELKAVPASQYTGGPQNLPGGYNGQEGIIPGGYPGTTQITDPEERTRVLNVEIQNGRAAMLGVTGAMVHSMLDSCDHHFFYPLTHN